MVATALIISASCSSVGSDESASADPKLGVYTDELRALRIGNNRCSPVYTCGAVVADYGDSWTKPISEAYMGNVVFSYDRSGDDAGLRGWFMLKEWAQAVGCQDFGDWVLSRQEKTVNRSCSQETMFLSYYTGSLYTKLLSNGPCGFGDREDSWCGARFNSIVDGEVVWMPSDIWDRPWQTVDMGEVYFAYVESRDRFSRGQKALIQWAEIVGCTNVDDWVFAADWQAAGYPPTPCSGDIVDAWNGMDPRTGS